MEYLEYKRGDVLNGAGLRNVLWLSRCSHGCEGCFNKDSWKGGGTKVTPAFIDQLIQDLDKSYIKGLTLSGGDPLHKRNYKEVISLCRRIKRELPEKDLWLYTGYTLEQIQSDILRAPILKVVDFIMDGKYDHTKPTEKPYRGSYNQILWEIKNGEAIHRGV